MPTPFRSLARLAAALLSVLLCKGCKPGGPGPEPSPAAPGTSHQLAYPVLLIGQANLDVRDSVDDLTRFPGTTTLNLPERLILDSDGRLFEVVRDTLVEKAPPFFIDLGTRQRLHYLELRERPPAPWPERRELLLEQVRDPRSTWAGDERALARVRSLENVAQAIEAARESWQWARE